MQIGEKVKNWTIIEEVKYITKENWKKTKYRIKCDCGFVRSIDPWDLKNIADSCKKCNNLSYWSEKNNLDLYKLIYVDYKHQAKRRGYIFELTLQEAYELFISECHYCGNSPSNVKTHNVNKNISFKYQGIDRIDPNKNYVLGNVLPCCSRCNYAKREMSYDEFLNWIKQVYNFGVQRLERKFVDSSESKQRPPYSDRGEMI